MNVEKGDLAVVVRGPNLGAMCRVLQQLEPDPFMPTDGPAWWIEALTSMRCFYTGVLFPPGDVGFIEDCRLRPLRDPGDEAVDETLLWEPVPSATRETTHA